MNKQINKQKTGKQQNKCIAQTKQFNVPLAIIAKSSFLN